MGRSWPIPLRQTWKRRGIMRDLEGVGIDFHCVTWQLQHEGVQKFIEPYDVLMQALTAKRQAILGERS